jgi:hypothetical protein
MDKVSETTSETAGKAGKAAMEMGVDLVSPALTNPDLVSFVIFVIMTIAFAAWVVYLARKH